MIKLIDNIRWLPSYYERKLIQGLGGSQKAPDGKIHVYFAVCDHYEPYRAQAGKSEANARISAWIDSFPKAVDSLPDSEGRLFAHSFFYPEEEYDREDLNRLARFCEEGFGELEVHLHHDNDTPRNLELTLLNYKARLREDHGFLGTEQTTGETVYGFIHGNWALDNSHPQGRWCGVNGELEILKKTGCYADFTMPSAPNATQSKKVNSIYYGMGSPARRKAYDTGVDAAVGRSGEGLLMIQGPLSPSWSKRKFGVVPKIENGALQAGREITGERVEAWLDAAVGVSGAPGHRFVKLYTHGAQELTIEYFFGPKRGFRSLLQILREVTAQRGYELHFVTAREMANAALALAAGVQPWDWVVRSGFRFTPPPNRKTTYLGAKP